MNAWRVTPMRVASRSIVEQIDRKVDLHPLDLAPGAGSSTGRSERRSNSLAEIMGGGSLPFEALRFLAVACAPDRDEADRVFMAIGRTAARYRKYTTSGLRLLDRSERNLLATLSISDSSPEVPPGSIFTPISSACVWPSGPV